MPEIKFSKVILRQTDDHVWKHLVNLARKRKVNLYEADFADGIEGLFMSKGKADFIFINDNLSESKRNFVLAHELGHMMLHKNRCDTTMYFSDQRIRNSIEKEADRFAGKLINLLNRRFYNE